MTRVPIRTRPSVAARAQDGLVDEAAEAALVADRVAGQAGPGVDRHPVGVGGPLALRRGLEPGPGDVARVLLVPVDVPGHPGVDRADDERGDLGALRLQLGP